MDDYIYIYIYIYLYIKGGIHGVIVTVKGNGHDNPSSNPGQHCISHGFYSFGEGMYPTM